MGRSLGYFDSDELDRPELNKCPDCECYFATEACPLCGKICPENFRAGNRAKVKKPKKRKNSSGRVQFIPWYHTWLFIIIMMFIQPVIGIILFFTSPYSAKAKITTAALVVVGGILVTGVHFLVPLGIHFFLADQFEPSFVNDEVSREEYVALCQSMSVEDYHRNARNQGNYVTMDLVVESKTDTGVYIFYLCKGKTEDQQNLRVLIMDCGVDQKTNYLVGDMIRVFGECSGVTDSMPDQTQDGTVYPLLYMAYSDLIG